MPRHCSFGLLLGLALGTSACLSMAPSPAPQTPPLRSAEAIAKDVGEQTRATEKSSPDLVLYASSISSDSSTTPKEQDATLGSVTVYAKPSGEIVIDGEPTSQTTTATITQPPGPHDVQVRFSDGTLSEPKHVEIKKGSRIKLFFRGADAPEKSDETDTTQPAENKTETKEEKPAMEKPVEVKP